MLSSTVPRLAGAVLVLVLGWGLANLVGRGVTLLLGAVELEESVRRGAVALVRLLTLLVVLDLLGRLSPATAGLAMLILGWVALRPGSWPAAREPSHWAERPPEVVAVSAPSVRDDEGRPLRSAYDRRRLARPGPDRRSADGAARRAGGA
jgi:hypothetical protein